MRVFYFQVADTVSVHHDKTKSDPACREPSVNLLNIESSATITPSIGVRRIQPKKSLVNICQYKNICKIVDNEVINHY